MTTSLYYTFSTIAQTLAGAIGLLGAFVLFRLQSLREEIERDAKEIANVVDGVVGGQEAQMLCHDGKYDELLERLASTTVPSSHNDLVRERRRFPVLLRRKKSVIWWFKIASCLTIGLIMGSVLVLVGAEQIACYALWAAVVFTVGLLWLFACLVTYLLLMFELVR